MPAWTGDSERTSFQTSSAVAQPKSVPIRLRELGDDPQVVAGLAGRVECFSHALDATLGVRDRALAFHPGVRRRQDDIGQLGGRGQEHVLDDEELEPAKEVLRPLLVGLRLDAGSRRCT